MSPRRFRTVHKNIQNHKTKSSHQPFTPFRSRVPTSARPPSPH